MFSMITGINESKTLIKHILCECRYDEKRRFSERKWNSDQWKKNDKCCRKCKTRQVCEKDCASNLSTCNTEYGKYFAIIKDNLTIAYDKIIELYVKLSLNYEYKEKKLPLHYR